MIHEGGFAICFQFVVEWADLIN